MLQYGEHDQAAGHGEVRIGPLAARVVIADQQPLMLEGLAHVLRAIPASTVERCRTGAELLSALLKRQPDLAILDVRLGDPDGLAVLREVRGRGLQIPAILVTGPLRDTEVLEGIQLGIRGLVAKDAPIDDVAHCVRSVLGGGTSLDQSLVGRAMAALLTRETALRELAQVLTAREMQSTTDGGGRNAPARGGGPARRQRRDAQGPPPSHLPEAERRHARSVDRARTRQGSGVTAVATE